jgi:putative endonuclease
MQIKGPAKYTRARLPVALVYSERYQTKGSRRRLKWPLKRLNRSQKLVLIKGRVRFFAPSHLNNHGW